MNVGKKILEVLRESTTFEREALWELAMGNDINYEDKISQPTFTKVEKPVVNASPYFTKKSCDGCKYNDGKTPCKFNDQLQYEACGEKNGYHYWVQP